jgi:hypothetical protein
MQLDSDAVSRDVRNAASVKAGGVIVHETMKNFQKRLNVIFKRKIVKLNEMSKDLVRQGTELSRAELKTCEARFQLAQLDKEQMERQLVTQQTELSRMDRLIFTREQEIGELRSGRAMVSLVSENSSLRNKEARQRDAISTMVKLLADGDTQEAISVGKSAMFTSIHEVDTKF